MKKGSMMMLLLALLFGLASVGFAATVTKVDGDKITVKDDKGVEKIFTGNKAGLKIGDTVTVKDGKVIKTGSSRASSNLNPQPEPPTPTSAFPKGPDQKKMTSTPEAPTTPPKK